ncbi:MAG: class I SAM-dependent methyltransferase [Candidatus Bathyarchaeota archaeon]|nr:MAG: class I SAM-dependent methyltransferase [Candidatus Bathyarchaeota archaeon]
MSHWTEEIFVEFPEIFAEFLKERTARADSEVNLLLRLLNEQGFNPEKILDLNCGIGRHSVELGKRGISVLGTDLSPYYIRIAEEMARENRVDDRVHFKVVDMRQISSTLCKEKFDGVLNLFTSFGYYDDKTNIDILKQCNKLVDAGGFFALEIMNRDWIIRNFQRRGFSRCENVIILEERFFDTETSRMKATWTCLEQQDETNFVLKKEFVIDHRLWSLHELIDLFEKAGWKYRKAYHGFDQQQSDIPLTQAHRLLLVTAKRT